MAYNSKKDKFNDADEIKEESKKILDRIWKKSKDKKRVKFTDLMVNKEDRFIKEEK